MQVVPVVVPELELVRVAHLATISIEMLSCTAEGARSYQTRCRMGNDVRVSLATASFFTGADYLQVHLFLLGMQLWRHVHMPSTHPQQEATQAQL